MPVHLLNIDLEKPDVEDQDIELLDIEKLEKQVKKQMKRQMKEILVWRKKIETKEDNIMAVRKARHDKQIENSQRNREVYTAKLEKEKKMLNEIQNVGSQRRLNIIPCNSDKK